MFGRKSKTDKEIEQMCDEMNSKFDRWIEETKPDDEKLNDFIDLLIERNG